MAAGGVAGVAAAEPAGTPAALPGVPLSMRERGSVMGSKRARRAVGVRALKASATAAAWLAEAQAAVRVRVKV